MMRPRALYSVEYHHTEGVSVVAIEDLDGAVSITNDAEAVVAALARRPLGILGSRIIYRDSMGQWDELLHDGEAFKGFAPIGVLTLEAALVALEDGDLSTSGHVVRLRQRLPRRSLGRG